MFQIVKDVRGSGPDYVKDGVLHVGGTGGGVMLENGASDIPNLPTSYFPGTMAHMPGWKAAWEKKADGGWKNIVGGADVGV